MAAKLDPGEFPDARIKLELLDRLFPRRPTGGTRRTSDDGTSSNGSPRRRSSKPQRDGGV
jgi:hypothetical protein